MFRLRKLRLAQPVRTCYNQPTYADLPAETWGAVGSLLEGRANSQLKREYEKLSVRKRAHQPLKTEIQELEEAGIGWTDRAPPARNKGAEAVPMSYSPKETLAYTAHRLLPAYSICWKIMADVREKYPEYAPTNALDFGAGPGSATQAAHVVWGDTLRKACLVDTSVSMLETAMEVLRPCKGLHVQLHRSLLSATPTGATGGVAAGGLAQQLSPAAKLSSRQRSQAEAAATRAAAAAAQRAAAAAGGAGKPSARDRNRATAAAASASAASAGGEPNIERDLVLAAYVLSELPSDKARMVATSMLWERVAEGGLLVLVERGDPFGSHTVRSARRLLLERFGCVGEGSGPEGGGPGGGGLGNSAADGAADGTSTGGSRRRRRRPLPPVAAEVLAPCLHSRACPQWDLEQGSAFKGWCHFTQRVRSPKTKHVGKPTKDERYSYVVIRKVLRKGSESAAATPAEEGTGVGAGADAGTAAGDEAGDLDGAVVVGRFSTDDFEAAAVQAEAAAAQAVERERERAWAKSRARAWAVGEAAGGAAGGGAAEGAWDDHVTDVTAEQGQAGASGTTKTKPKVQPQPQTQARAQAQTPVPAPPFTVAFAAGRMGVGFSQFSDGVFRVESSAGQAATGGVLPGDVVVSVGAHALDASWTLEKVEELGATLPRPLVMEFVREVRFEDADMDSYEGDESEQVLAAEDVDELVDALEFQAEAAGVPEGEEDAWAWAEEEDGGGAEWSEGAAGGEWAGGEWTEEEIRQWEQAGQGLGDTHGEGAGVAYAERQLSARDYAIGVHDEGEHDDDDEDEDDEDEERENPMLSLGRWVTAQRLLSRIHRQQGFDVPAVRWRSGRIIRQPILSARHIMLDVCTADGSIRRLVIGKAGGPLYGPFGYRAARKIQWGDVWPVAEVQERRPAVLVDPSALTDAQKDMLRR